MAGSCFPKCPTNPIGGKLLDFLSKAKTPPKLRNADMSQTQTTESAANQDQRAQVEAVLTAYEAALNAADTAAVLPLYTDDGVFMSPNSPSAVGLAAIRHAYDAVFGAIRLTVKFHVVEVVVLAPDWAFARTNSAGTVKIHATGAQSAEANQELFLFQKSSDGAWKIARYSFSTTNPPRPD